MPLDAAVINALKNELKEELIGARIDKVQMPEKDVLLLSVRGNQGNRKLLLSSNVGTARVHFTEMSFENPSEPPMFCMLMRKHLVGARIVDILQPDFERMLIFQLSSRDEMGVLSEKQLVVELLGRASNIILVNEEGNIIDCIRRADFGETAVRRLLPGMLYRMPSKQNKTPFYTVDSSERRHVWQEAEDNNNPEKSIMDLFSGLSPLICREIVYRCYGEIENIPESMDVIADTVREEQFLPIMLTQDGSPKDYSFMNISQYSDEMRNVQYDSFSEMLDEFYSKKDFEESMRRKSKALLHNVRTARDRTQRKLNARLSEMEKTESRDQIRREADLITANMYQLKKGMDSFKCNDFYEEDNREVIVMLDPLKTPQQNAALKYKEYNKLKTAREYLEKLIEENKGQVDYLNSVIDEISRAESERDLAEIRKELTETGYLRVKRNAKKEKVKVQVPYRFVSDDGFEILVGRNNNMNDDLTMHRARRTDYWLHTQKIHGSHVIIQCEDQTPPPRTIEQAAILAAYYSQARDGGKVPVDYTMVRNLKKPNGAMPGYVIYHVYDSIVVESNGDLVQKLQKQG